jgi:hypothetical protein
VWYSPTEAGWDRRAVDAQNLGLNPDYIPSSGVYHDHVELRHPETGLAVPDDCQTAAHEHADEEVEVEAQLSWVEVILGEGSLIWDQTTSSQTPEDCG